MSAFYDTGTISINNGGTLVTGVGTSWVSTIRAGWLIRLPNGEMGPIESVISNTQLRLLTAYGGSTQTNRAYWATATGGIISDLITELNARNADVQDMLDGPGAGLFSTGSEAQPGVSFEVDQDTGIRRSSSNNLAITTGGVDRAIFGPNGMTGPAVQSSPVDVGDGKLLTVGSFGWGSNTGVRVNNLDTHYISGNYFSYQGNHPSVPAGDNPFPNEGGAFGLFVGNTDIGGGPDKYVYQLATALSNHTPQIRLRSKAAGDWAPWTVVWTDTLVEKGSNANGNYVRYPDGTQICRIHNFVTNSGSPKTWSLPASFLNNNYAVVASATNEGLPRTITARGASASAVIVEGWNESGSDLVAPSANLIAIGQWK